MVLGGVIILLRMVQERQAKGTTAAILEQQMAQALLAAAVGVARALLVETETAAQAPAGMVGMEQLLALQGHL